MISRKQVCFLLFSSVFLTFSCAVLDDAPEPQQGDNASEAEPGSMPPMQVNLNLPVHRVNTQNRETVSCVQPSISFKVISVS